MKSTDAAISRAQLKSLKLQDGDIVLMRWADATARNLQDGQRALTEALATTGREVIGICVPETIDIERIPMALSAEALDRQAMRELAILRDRVRELKRAATTAHHRHRKDLKDLEGRLTAEHDEVVKNLDRRLSRAIVKLDALEVELSRRKGTKRLSPPKMTAKDLASWALPRLREVFGWDCVVPECRYHQGFGQWCAVHAAFHEAIVARER